MFGFDDFLIMLAVSLVLQVVSYVLSPQAKKQKPEFMKDLEEPTADAGKPIPVVFGTMTLKSPNILWYGDKARHDYTV